MRNRLASAHRVLDVQLNLRRIAELRLAELERREQALVAEETELVRYLGGESPFAPVLALNLSLRLRNNARTLLETRQAKESQEKTVLERAARAKLGERMIAALELEMHRSEERRELGQLIEQFLARSATSFR